MERTDSSQSLPKVGSRPAATKARDDKLRENKKVKEIKKKKAESENFMTDKRIEKMKAILIKIQNYTNTQLKDILRKNGQSMSGNKTELLGKVADGMMFGKVPKCPNCNGGRPKMDLATGHYHCNGYYEDEAFFQCDAVFEFSQLSREPWLN